MDFSIVIPTYNRAKHLNNCLSSLLIQTKKPFERIVVKLQLLPEFYGRKKSITLLMSNFARIILVLYRNVNKIK